MGKERGIDGRQIFDSMVNFARRGPDNGVNNFVLTGPVDVPTMFHTFVGKFPDLKGSDSAIVVAGTRRSNINDVYSQILHLEVPQRVDDIKVIESEAIKRANEISSVQNNLPSIVIGIGETRDTEEKVIVLFSVAGILPRKALLEIQDRIKSRMAKFN